MVCRGERAEALVNMIDNVLEKEQTELYTLYLKRKMGRATLLRKELSMLKNIRNELVVCDYFREARELEKVIDVVAGVLRLDSGLLTNEFIHELIVLVDRVLAVCRDGVWRTGVASANL